MDEDTRATRGNRKLGRGRRVLGHGPFGIERVPTLQRWYQYYQCERG